MIIPHNNFRVSVIKDGTLKMTCTDETVLPSCSMLKQTTGINDTCTAYRRISRSPGSGQKPCNTTHHCNNRYTFRVLHFLCFLCKTFESTLYTPASAQKCQRSLACSLERHLTLEPVTMEGGVTLAGLVL